MIRALIALLLFASPALALAGTPIDIDAVLARMNEQRAKRELPPLRHDERLARAAAARMRDMIEQEYWSHEAPDGRSPFFWVASYGYRYRTAGENLARGFETAELLVDSWMESDGHRANILGAEFTDAGIAIVDGATTGPGPGKSIVVLFGRE